MSKLPCSNCEKGFLTVKFDIGNRLFYECGNCKYKEG
jgi:hypothetical protein